MHGFRKHGSFGGTFFLFIRPYRCGESDQAALETAILPSGAVIAEACRLVLVKNTLKLDQFIAEALLDDIRRKDTVKVLEDLGEIAFTEQGNLSNLP